MLTLALAGCLNGLPTASADPTGDAPATGAEPARAPAPHDHPIEVAVVMLRLQTHAGKLWFAGQAGNWDLADFYVHELEEDAETVARAHAVEEGYSLTVGVETLFEPAHAKLEAVLAMDDGDPDAKKKAFGVAYAGLMGACNGCHEAAKHGFIKVRPPKINHWTHQEF